MRIPIAKLPASVIDRLRAIQADPAAHDCFYQMEETGRGLALTTLVLLGSCVLLLLPIALGRHLYPPWAVLAGLLLGAVRWHLLPRIGQRRSGLRPMTMLNPLYLVRTDPSHLTYHSLWSELIDLRITHRFAGRSFRRTVFDFKFKGGQGESILCAPERQAEQLARTIEAYRRRMLSSLDAQDFGTLAEHDLFAELHLSIHRPKQSTYDGAPTGRKESDRWRPPRVAGRRPARRPSPPRRRPPHARRGA